MTRAVITSGVVLGLRGPGLTPGDRTYLDDTKAAALAAASSIAIAAADVSALSAVTVDATARLGPVTVTAGDQDYAPDLTLLLGTADQVGDVTAFDVSIKAVGSGELSLDVLSGDAPHFTLVARHPLPAPTAIGIRSYTADDVGTVDLLAGQSVAVSTPAGGVRLASITTPDHAGIFLTSRLAAIGDGADFGVNPGCAWAASAAFAYRAVSVPRANLNAVDAASLAALEGSTAVLAALPQITGTATMTYGNVGHTFDGSFAGYSLMMGPGDGVTRGGPVTALTLPMSTPGPVDILIVTPLDSGKLDSVVAVSLVTTVVGDNPFTATDLGGLSLSVGQRLASYAHDGAQVQTSNQVPGSVGRYLFGKAGGIQAWGTNPGVMYGGSYTVAASALLIGEDNLTPELAAKVNAGTGGSTSVPTKPVILLETEFENAAPANWSISGAWTYSAAGMMTPVGAGDASQTACLQQPMGEAVLSVDRRTDRWVIVPQAAGAALWLGNIYGGASRATMLRIDDGAHTLAFALSSALTGLGALPTVSTSAALAPLTAGRRYLVELRRGVRVVTATVTDLLTGAVMGTITDGTETGNLFAYTAAGYLFGSPAIINVSRQTLVERFASASDVSNPRLMVAGDSRSGLLAYGMTGADTWFERTRTALGGSAVISGLDGSQGLARIPELIAHELPAIMPQWLLEAFGTNDTDASLAAYQAAMQQLLAWCDANGVRLATAILPPASGRSLSAINAYKLSLPRRVLKVRLDQALTVNHDGVTADASKNDGNDLHPGPVGQPLLFAQVRQDMREAFQ